MKPHTKPQTIEYIVITALYANQLMEKVNQALKEGFVLYGNMSCSNGYMYQPMVKESIHQTLDEI